MFEKIEKDGLLPMTHGRNFAKIFGKENNLCILEGLIAGVLEYPIEKVRGNLTLATEFNEIYERENMNSVSVILSMDGENIHIQLNLWSK